MSKRVSGHVVVGIDGLSSAVRDILMEYSDYVVDITRDVVREVTKEAAKVVRDAGTYQNRRPKYRKSIGSKMQNSIFGAEGIVYARDHEYSLTHLLENGHKLWNAPYVRTRAFKHWINGEEYAIEVLPSKIAKRIGG